MDLRSEHVATAAGERLQVLLVEDSSADAALVRAMLADAASGTLDVTRVARLGEAREHLRSADVGCVLLDLSLPDSQGLETVIEIVAVAPEVPVVVLTGMDDETTGILAVHEGAQDYLDKKLLTGQVLLRTVRYAIERKRNELAIRHMASHDLLTGLANRGLFFERLRLAIARLARSKLYLCLALLDLDRFKWVNDSLGHAAGDDLLEAFARRLESTVRAPDLVARIGGDEFLVLWEDVPSENVGLMLATRIQQALLDPFTIAGIQIWLQASVGLTMTRDALVSEEELVRQADTAMYRAKGSGKGHTELFDVQMSNRVAGRLELANDLQRGLAEGEFTVFYQPIVEIGTGITEGAEALIRWKHRDGRLVLPGEFIGLAEETGVIVALGDFVLESVCTQVAAWAAEGQPRHPGYVTVNVSARQLTDGTFPQRMREILNQTGADPARVGLEVTESTLLQDEEGSLAQLRQLKELGLRLYIDDFGTGYSSLTYLARFPFDVIKIDMSFVQQLGRNAQSSAIVEGVIRLADALGLSVVAEGVERVQQADELVKLGCRLAQGFLFARPSAAENLRPVYNPTFTD